MTLQERRQRRFSENFKKEIVVELESGNLTVRQVSLAYEVKQDNVKRWIHKYGREPLPKGILIQSPAEINKLRELEKETVKLKQIIGEQQIKILYLEQIMRLAKEKLGDDFEKKPDEYPTGNQSQYLRNARDYYGANLSLCRLQPTRLCSSHEPTEKRRNAHGRNFC